MCSREIFIVPHLGSGVCLDLAGKQGIAGPISSIHQYVVLDQEGAFFGVDIKQVMMAFKEIQRLKELLELERNTQEALVTKLQQQNHEVAAEVSQLRLKLASLLLKSPLPSQKVHLHPGRRPSLSPIKEAESSEVESEVTQSQAPGSDAEMSFIVRERENHCSDFATTAGGKDNGIFNESEGTKQYDECAPLGECEASYPLANNVSESQGKENKDPELLPRCKGDSQMTNEEDGALQRKRPRPRPLPDLLSNILHRCRDAADQSESSVKYGSKGEALHGTVPISEGNFKPAVFQLPSQLAQASSSQGLHDLSTGLSGHQEGCTFHVPSQTAKPPLVPLQQCQTKTSVDLDGHEHITRLEAGGKDVLGCKHLHAHCKCTTFPQCLPNCLQRRPSSNLTNAVCPEQLGGSEKVRTVTCSHEDLVESKPCASQKKLRFDPTAGEEGIFYYVSDVEKNVKENPKSASLLPTGSKETQGVEVEEKAERASSSMSPKEGERLERDTLDSHWTPEAIERRNSFHRIPVVSPRSANSDEWHADEKRLFSDGFSTKIKENEARREVSHTKEQAQLPASQSEVLSMRSEKSYHRKPRRSSHRTSRCMNCSSIHSRRSKRAVLSSKLFAKYPLKCSKCSSIVGPKASIHWFGMNEANRGRMARNDKCSKGKRGRQNSGSSIDSYVLGTEEDFNVSHPSTPASSGNVANCGKCTTRLKSGSSQSPQQKPRRGKVGMKSCVSADEEGSDPASLLYCVASEDMYMSTHSSTNYSIKGKRHVPSFPLKVGRIHTRKIKKKRGRGREVKSVKLLGDQSSEPTEEVFHVNREVLDMLLHSDGKCSGQLKAPLADSTKCRIETWRFGKTHQSPHKRSTKEGLEQTSTTNSGSHARDGQLSADLYPRRGLILSRTGRQRAPRLYDHVQGRKPTSEKWKSFEVDDLLDKFIQSNAECAAELIKCSVYFESTSTSSRPSSQSTLVTKNPTEEKIPFRNATVPEQGIKGGSDSPESVQPRRELFRLDHTGFTSTQRHPQESIRCSRCGVCINPGRDLPPLGTIEVVGRRELRVLCDTCSASVTPEKIKVVRRSADLDQSRQSSDIAPPIVLPHSNCDVVVKTHEAGRAQKPSAILIYNVNRSGDRALETFHDPPDLANEDLRMPIISGVSVSSRRSTPPPEMEEADTTKELAEMFDMSLYDLVNDLEGQRRAYWRRVNRQSLDEGKRIVAELNSRGRVVHVDKVEKSCTTRRPIPRKQNFR